tara:strand:+ start:402 stop:776 length:375 start_codon:yes stop_codon:yes gene_type:complete
MIGLKIFQLSSKKIQKLSGQKTSLIFMIFFYRQSDIKVGGSDNHIKTNLEKNSSKKIIISTLQNPNKSLSSISKESYSYAYIPIEIIKSIKERSFEGKNFYKNLSNKNIFNLRSYFLGLKSLFF